MDNSPIIWVYDRDADAPRLLNQLTSDARESLVQRGFIEAGDGDIAERTLAFRAPAGSRWLMIEDDEEAGDLQWISWLSGRCRGPLIEIEYANEALMALTLYAAGNIRDRLVSFPQDAIETLSEEEQAEYGKPPVARTDRWVGMFGGAPTQADFEKAMRSPAPLVAVCRLLAIPLKERNEPSESESAASAPVVLRFRRASSSKPVVAAPPEADAAPAVATHLIPVALCGKSADVKRRWRSIAKKALASASWSKGLEGIEMIPLASAPGKIVMGDRMHFLVSGSNVYAEYIWLTLEEESEKGLGEAPDPKTISARYSLWRKLVLDGMDEFWFCLAVLTQESCWFPYFFDEAEAPRVAAEMLVKLLKWWKEFPLYQDRCVSLAPMLGHQPWMAWGTSIIFLVSAIGATLEETRQLGKVDSEEAEGLVRQWLKRSRERLKGT